MDILITGPFGRVGTAIIDHLGDDAAYDLTYLNRSDRDEYDTFVANISDFEAIRPAFEDKDAVIHLASCARVDGSWENVLENDIIGTCNVLEATADAGVETFVFASSNHIVGMYEAEHAPKLYELDYDLTVDHNSPRRPDSYYGSSKGFGEDIGRYYVENFDAPTQFYSLRICSIRYEEYDHPYGDAEIGVNEGNWERGSLEYERKVARMKAMWQSRRDFAHMIERCLEDETVEYDVFYGVSANDRRWFDIDHAREVIGYKPQDNGEEWRNPPRQG